MKKTLFSLLLASSIQFTQAQIDHTLYNLSNVPQIQWVNPALQPTTKWYFANSAYIKVANTGFAPKDLLQNISNDTLFFNAATFVNKLNRRNHIQAAAMADIGFGFRIMRKIYIQAGINERVIANVSIPKDLFEFAILGNAHPTLIGEELNIGGFDINAIHYRERFLGVSYAPNCNMSFGARIKGLQGLENIKSTDTKLSIRTDPTNYDLFLKSNLDIQTSGILDENSADKYKSGFPPGRTNNSGLGLDLGAAYAYKKFKLSASLLDLGFITWRDNTMRIRSKNPNQEFAFSGVDYNQIDSNDVGAYFSKLADSLIRQFGVDTTYNSTYRTSLSTRLYVGAQMQFKKLTVGATLFSEFYNGGLRPGFAIMARKEFGRWAELQVNYSYMNRNVFNLGLGGSVNLGPIQIFAMSDNVLGSLLFPLQTKVVQGRVGVNFGWWYGKDCKNPCTRFKEKCEECALEKLVKKQKKEDTDKDGVNDFWDSCVLIPGVLSLNGCPDIDGDFITDSKDSCPTQRGFAFLNGCPDDDKDSIANAQDNCPQAAGPASLGGCPDTDSDGILDINDNCTTVPGPAENKGCPWSDSDGDGFTDNIDDCPLIKGEAENKGCPWPDTDGDGLTDNEDHCPKDAGPRTNLGCPKIDSDGDGLADSEDNCPHTKGPVSNKGCPVIEVAEQEILNTAFNNLEFETGKSIIRNTSFASLVELAGLLKKKPKYTLSIAGHTDNVGSISGNLQLSKDRALAVQQFLLDNGVPAAQLNAAWFGPTKPIADNTTAEGRQKNRRVEMNVVFD